MITFFQASNRNVCAVSISTINDDIYSKLSWLFNGSQRLTSDKVHGWFIGPRTEMITPWSTNAVEIVQNMGIEGIDRIEEFISVSEDEEFDPMLQRKYNQLDQEIFNIKHDPEPIREIEDIAGFNREEGLALNAKEITYLQNVSLSIGRKLTDSEVFGFSQINSEHCRHKIFNGTFVIDGIEKPNSLFDLIKGTSSSNPNKIVSAYKDNVAFIKGPRVEQFAPSRQDSAEYFKTSEIDTVLSLKAETHNFPTTVEPFNGAATGSGGEIRDRMAGGKASIPLAGTAVYMTSYPRLEGPRKWEQKTEERDWLYQTPAEILIKASNGASDFGNKFGQPLISGSLLTFEHTENSRQYGYDKVIMLAGGIGFGNLEDSEKMSPEPGDKIVVLGGDNYRIGMGGSAVSSVETGEFDNSIELNAIQRSNPEMQKRVYNAIRAMSEAVENPIISIHDHGAGGHLNCLSELIEESGGAIDLNKLPVGDPTLSAKEIIGNESQERMGLIIKKEDLPLLENIAARERAPMYVVGETTGNMHFSFYDSNGKNPMDLDLEYLFGSSPKTVLEGTKEDQVFKAPEYDQHELITYVENVLQLEAVACKDWLTNKVDRSVTGKVAIQQSTGPVQLPLNNLGVMTLDYLGIKGVATSIGHAPIAALLSPNAGSRLSVAEALTNIIWAPIQDGLSGISLSANWMWPSKNPGEESRLYEAVESVSNFVTDLGINVPTGKDSLSMTQKYPDGTKVYSPGTVIISAVGEVSDVKKVVTPTLVHDFSSSLWHIDMSKDEHKLGGSSFCQVMGLVGEIPPTITNPTFFKQTFNAVQDLIKDGCVLAGHDISAGGLVTTLLEMTFSQNDVGLKVTLDGFEESDIIKILFSENPGIVLQLRNESDGERLISMGINAVRIGLLSDDRTLSISKVNNSFLLDIDNLRDKWFRTSYLFDKKQNEEQLAKDRFRNYARQQLQYIFPGHFNGRLDKYGIQHNRNEKSGVKAAIIREKGVNGDREMAYSMHLAGFDVKDVHMTDLVSGREDLADINFIVFVGGFSNSDVLGSAKGWAGAFLYNEKAKAVLQRFYARPDTLSLGVCNGCQLMMELNLLYPDMEDHPKMLHNASGKFESTFINVTVHENKSVMMKSLAGSRLGVWVAHGEGRFDLKGSKDDYNITGTYSYSEYPGNPNGSDFDAAIVTSNDGRHLAMMPHLERSIFPWQWPWYEQNSHEVTPWIEAYVNARKWIERKS